MVARGGMDAVGPLTFFVLILACTDSSGIPRQIGETWNTSVNGCCMYKCVANETIIPVPYNCSHTQQMMCHRYGEVTVTAPDNHTCCPRQMCRKCAVQVLCHRGDVMYMSTYTSMSWIMCHTQKVTQ